MLHGKYIVIEGVDGVGKSEQAERLLRHLTQRGIPCLSPPIHEPRGVPASLEIRAALLNPAYQRDPWTNVILFTAIRRLNWFQAIKPALERGEWVVTARSWISTAIYQGYGEGVDIGKIKQRMLDDVGEEYMHPDLAVVLALNDNTIRNSRIGNRSETKHPDTFESRPQEFQDKLQDGYVRFAKENGLEVIDASPSLEEVEAAIWQRIEPLL